MIYERAAMSPADGHDGLLLLLRYIPALYGKPAQKQHHPKFMKTTCKVQIEASAFVKQCNALVSIPRLP